MIRLGISGWELHKGPACSDCQPHPGLRDRLRARLFIQQLTSETAAAIRNLLSGEVHPWPLPKITANDAADYMAILLSCGSWHFHAAALAKTVGAHSTESGAAPQEKDEAEIIKAAPPSRKPVARPQPVGEEGSLPRSADADAMEVASKLGIPFCEECAKAAVKKKQARKAA